MKALEEMVGFETAKHINNSLKASPFRRLSNDNEVSVGPEKLCQSFHINKIEGDSRLILGDSEGGYHMHSVESVLPQIKKMQELGIGKIYLGTDAEIGSHGGYDEKLENFSAILKALRLEVGKDLEILIDPAGLCLRKDLRWGVTGDDGSIDAASTIKLLAKAAVKFSECGADSILTIGRANCEVVAVKEALRNSGMDMRVLSFSTNSETTSAYFETTQHDILRSRTGQKILVGNVEEMVVRAISDFGEGSDAIVQKPVEAFQLPAILSLISSGVVDIDAYISESSVIGRLLEKNPTIVPAFEKGVAQIKSGERKLKVGTYEVSGTYSNVQLLAQKFSEQLGWSMLDEIMLNASGACGSAMDIMISRNASWYLEKQYQYAAKSEAA